MLKVFSSLLCSCILLSTLIMVMEERVNGAKMREMFVLLPLQGVKALVESPRSDKIGNLAGENQQTFQVSLNLRICKESLGCNWILK